MAVVKAEKKEDAKEVLDASVQEALNKLPIPHVNKKQVDKAAKAVEKVTAKSKDVSADKQLVVKEPISKLVLNTHLPSDLPAEWPPKEFLSKEDMEVIPKPWVVVDGKVVEPIQREIPGQYRITTETKQTFWMPHTNTRDADIREAKFNYYELSVGGAKLHVLMDQKSSLYIRTQGDSWGHEGGADFGRAHQRDRKLILLNSSSHDDQFFGESSLDGIDSRGTRYFASSITIKPITTPHDLPWRGPDRGRRQVKYSSFYQSIVSDCVLSDGVHLKDTTLELTQVQFSEGVSMDGCRMKDVTIRGTRGKFKFSNLDRTRIPSTGNVLLVNTNLKDAQLSEKPLFVPNKFSTLQVDLPDGQVSVWRQNSTTLNMNIAYRQAFEIKLDCTIDELDAQVRAMLKDYHYRNPLDPEQKDPVIASLINYVVQSIRSRMRVIKMLDSAVRTARVVTGDVRRDENEDYYPDFAIF